MAFLKDEDGLELTEYAIVGGLIVIATITIISTIGDQLTTLWTKISSALTTAGG